MTAGFCALRDEGNTPVSLEPTRFPYGCGGTKHYATSRLDALDERMRRQPEVKTNDVWTQVLNYFAQPRIEWIEGPGFLNVGQLDTEFGIVFAELGFPLFCTFMIRRRLLMAEEV
jgi:hypothetical protein